MRIVLSVSCALRPKYFSTKLHAGVDRCETLCSCDEAFLVVVAWSSI